MASPPPQSKVVPMETMPAATAPPPTQGEVQGKINKLQAKIDDLQVEIEDLEKKWKADVLEDRVLAQDKKDLLNVLISERNGFKEERNRLDCLIKDFFQHPPQAQRSAQPSNTTELVSLLANVLDVQRDLERKALANIRRSTFAIMDGDEPVGVAVAITTQHFLTAWHNIEDNIRNPIVLRPISSPLFSPAAMSASASAGSSSVMSEITATYEYGDKELDWVLLKLTTLDVELHPATIFKGDLEDELAADVTLIGLDAVFMSEASQLHPTFKTVKSYIMAVYGARFRYDATAFPGDNRGPIVFTRWGHVCGLHVARVYKAPNKKAAKVGKSPRLEKDDEDLSSSLSDNTTHIAAALRIDVIRMILVEKCAPLQMKFE